jgi:hypothetical protein
MGFLPSTEHVENIINFISYGLTPRPTSFPLSPSPPNPTKITKEDGKGVKDEETFPFLTFPPFSSSQPHENEIL